MAKLTFPSSDRPPHNLGGPVVIGRSEDQATLVINDQRLSRAHCEIKQVGADWVVKDAGSRNGTKVNDQDVTGERKLKNGDELSLGGLKIVFHAAAAPDPDETGPLALETAELEPVKDAADGPVPVLKLVKGTLSTVLIKLDAFPYTVGRKPTCNLPLPDDSQASSNHARFERLAGGDIKLVDLNSTNGTRVEGKTIKEQLLKDGDRIQIGSQLFRFMREMSAEEARRGSNNETVAIAPSKPIPADAVTQRKTVAAPKDDFDDIDLDDLDEISLDDDPKPAKKPAKETKAAPAASKSSEPPAAPISAPVQEVSFDDDGDKDDEDDAEARAEAERLEKVKVDTRGTGGKGLVRAVEIVLGLLVLGAIVGFAVYATGESKQHNAAAGGSTTKPLGPHGLLPTSAIASFESTGGEGAEQVLDGWGSRTTASTDSVMPMADVGVGGQQVMRVQRYGDSTAQTLWYCLTPISVAKGKPYVGSVFVQMPEKTGTAFLFMEWYREIGDSAPIRRDTRAFATGHISWTKLEGKFTAPRDATAARFGVGVTGKRGVVLFDSANLVEDAATPAAAPSVPAAPNTPRVSIGEEAALAIASTDNKTLLSNFSFAMTGPGESVSHAVSTIEPPVFAEQQGSVTIGLSLWDPSIERARSLRITAADGRISASLEQVAESRIPDLRLSVIASDALMPDGAAVFNNSGEIVAYGSNFKSETAQRVDFVNTQNAHRLATGNQLSVSGRTLTFSASAGTINLALVASGDRREFAALLSVMNGGGGANQERGHDPQRMTAALQLATSFPVDPAEVEAAAGVVGTVVTVYRIRRTELEQVVDARGDVGQSADLFIRAVDQATEFDRELTSMLQTWGQFSRPLDALLLNAAKVAPSDRHLARSRAAWESIRENLRAIDPLRGAFSGIAQRGRTEAFRYKARRESIEVQPMWASAQDHLASAETTQAELKLRALIRRFPLTHAASMARVRLLDIADRLRATAVEQKAQNLTRIAEESEQKAAQILDFVKSSRAQLPADFFDMLGTPDWVTVPLEIWRAAEDDVRKRTQG